MDLNWVFIENIIQNNHLKMVWKPNLLKCFSTQKDFQMNANVSSLIIETYKIGANGWRGGWANNSISLSIGET